MDMAITINIYYKGKDGSARKFAEEMVASGVARDIRAESGNLRYEYFFPMEDEETVMLVDSWENQEALDVHHASPMMGRIMELREKYDLRMTVERYVSDEAGVPEGDRGFIRN
jgi:quinol monooxygenase YgiN